MRLRLYHAIVNILNAWAVPDATVIKRAMEHFAVDLESISTNATVAAEVRFKINESVTRALHRGRG